MAETEAVKKSDPAAKVVAAIIVLSFVLVTGIYLLGKLPPPALPPVTYNVPPEQKARAEAAYSEFRRLCPDVQSFSRDIVEQEVSFYESYDKDWSKHHLHWKDWIEVRIRTADPLTLWAWGDYKYQPIYSGANLFFRLGTGRCSGMEILKDPGLLICGAHQEFVGTCDGPVPPPAWTSLRR